MIYKATFKGIEYQILPGETPGEALWRIDRPKSNIHGKATGMTSARSAAEHAITKLLSGQWSWSTDDGFTFPRKSH